MFTAEDVAEVRHIVQKILVPCVVVIGLLGNSVSVYVLTRKRMRCTTNIYLTALAITDIIYLLMVALLSLQHYEVVHLHYEIYWKCYGIVIWLGDVCAYISIYIAVCFTIERYIAIRYPLKRQTFCTESLAKKVLAGVALFCLLSTTSTPFEYEYINAPKLMDANEKECNATYLDLISHFGLGDDNMSTTERSQVNNLIEANIPSTEHYASESSEGSRLPLALDLLVLAGKASAPILQRLQQGDSSSINLDNIREANKCRNVTYYKHAPSNLANSETYKLLFFCFTWITFFLIPLGVLATFNCFLIVLVRRSKTRRGEMTNASSIRRTRGKSSANTSQENRITVTLIAVVILFIVCQLPWATYLLVSTIITIEDNNFQSVIGNIFNLLAAINAAANFFLYCVLSDKYRKTFKQLITGFRYGSSRNMSFSTSHMASSRRCRTPSHSVR